MNYFQAYPQVPRPPLARVVFSDISIHGFPKGKVAFAPEASEILTSPAQFCSLPHQEGSVGWVTFKLNQDTKLVLE